MEDRADVLLMCCSCVANVLLMCCYTQTESLCRSLFDNGAKETYSSGSDAERVSKETYNGAKETYSSGSDAERVSFLHVVTFIF